MRSVKFSIRTSSKGSSGASCGKQSRQASSAAAMRFALACESRPASAAKKPIAPPTPASRRASLVNLSRTRVVLLAKAIHDAEVASLAAVRAVVLPVSAHADPVLAHAYPAVAIAIALGFRFVADQAGDGLSHGSPLSRLYATLEAATSRSLPPMRFVGQVLAFLTPPNTHVRFLCAPG